MTLFILGISVHDLFLTFLVIFLLVLILIAAVVFYSFYQYKELNNIHEWSDLIDEKVSDAIVYGEDRKDTAKGLSGLLKFSSFRNLFLEKLVDSEKKFSGGARLEIRKIFDDYDLRKDALLRLRQRKPYLIAGGIQELTTMQVADALPEIEVFLSHPSPQVYQEAQYAMVVFKGFEGLHFLDTNTHKISEWQQLRLLRSLSSIASGAETMMEKWLKSPNDSIVIFTLRLLKKFQVLSFYNEVHSLLNHSSENVRIQAVHTMLALENASTADDLITSFPLQPEAVQLELLEALNKAKDRSCSAFFKEQLHNHPAAIVKIAAAEALYALGEEGYLTEQLGNPGSAEEVILIIKHALQLKI